MNNSSTTFDEKLAAAKKLLASKGLWRASYAPTLVAFLWRAGVRIPPPHFAGFFGVFLFSGAVFGVAWGLIMWWLRWASHGTPATTAAALSALVGALVGLAMAGYYRYSARHNAIPSWDSFDPSEVR